jgi:hypothetical protein
MQQEPKGGRPFDHTRVLKFITSVPISRTMIECTTFTNGSIYMHCLRCRKEVVNFRDLVTASNLQGRSQLP